MRISDRVHTRVQAFLAQGHYELQIKIEQEVYKSLPIAIRGLDLVIGVTGMMMIMILRILWIH